jgi:hypothetical protein
MRFLGMQFLGAHRKAHGGIARLPNTLNGSTAASSSLKEHVVDYSESIRPIHRVQFGIYLVEETLDFVALVRARIFFQAAEQMLLSRQQLCNACHRRIEFAMREHCRHSIVFGAAKYQATVRTVADPRR